MKRVYMDANENSWLNNYVNSFDFINSEFFTVLELVKYELKNNHRATYDYCCDNQQWYIDFEDERDYIAMVLKWS